MWSTTNSSRWRAVSQTKEWQVTSATDQEDTWETVSQGTALISYYTTPVKLYSLNETATTHKTEKVFSNKQETVWDKKNNIFWNI